MPRRRPDSGTVIVRARTDDDLPACVGILAGVHAAARYPIIWPTDAAAWLTPAGLVAAWVAVVDGTVSGHVALTRVSPATATVERLFADPGQGGRGIGRLLLDTVVSEARARGLALSLDVADNGTAAIALYRRAGWTETGRTAIDWGGNTAQSLIGFSPPR